MPTHELVIWWILAGVGILGSAFCSGLEVGLYSVSRVFVRVRSVDQPRAQALSTQIANPAPVLTTLLVYNNGFNYLATLSFTALLSTTDLSDTLIIIIQAAVLTPILLIFAESIPKELFRSRPNSIMERLIPLVITMRWTLTIVPITPVITWFANTVAKLMGADYSGSVQNARQHMADLIKHGDQKITKSQTEMIDRALQLNQTPVHTAMLPIASVIRISSSSTVTNALASIKKSNHSRYPVQDPDGCIIGCVQTIDLYACSDDTIASLIKPVVHLPVKTPMRQALTMMNNSEARLGVVTREGQDVGLVTRKDLFSPLIDATHDW
ncbi:MAG: CNNM domain-containing protein [Phycisphaerales bacterium]